MTKAAVATKKFGRKPKAKVKSGCRTCKIRKVKCDEAFPVCTRCRSTGRTCDGYGVWGGGGNHYGQRPASEGPRDMCDFPPLVCISILVASTDEMASFDWFRGRTIVKIPGSYLSDFWTKIILQVSRSERAVWHAVMALSSTHRVGFIEANSEPASKLEQVTLRHLVKAVSQLHRHFSAQDKSSTRVVLMVCLVFIVLDLLRGHFASAQLHLHNGLHILETQFASAAKLGDSHNPLNSCSTSVDDSVAEAFFRLHTQVELLQHAHRPRAWIFPPPIQLPLHEDSSSEPLFNSYTIAWRGLDRLMNDVFRLYSHARNPAAKEEAEAKDLLAIHQARIARGLHAWLKTYDVSLPSLQLSISPAVAAAKAKVHRLVISYHIMLDIMTETASYPDNETIFDNYTSQHREIISLLSETYKLSTDDTHHPTSPASTAVPYGQKEPSPLHLTGKDKEHAKRTERLGGCDMSHTIIDIGWMIPLFHVAVKCRQRRTRRQAIQLLESTNHREGIWDAQITACIARRVMEIEEGDFYDPFPIFGNDNVFTTTASSDGERVGFNDQDSSVQSASTISGLNLDLDLDFDIEPILPESCRIRDLEVRMEGDPLEKVILFGGWEGMEEGSVCLGEYHVLAQRWL